MRSCRSSRCWGLPGDSRDYQGPRRERGELPVIVLSQGAVLGLDSLVQWSPHHAGLESLSESERKYLLKLLSVILLLVSPGSAHKAVASGHDVDDVHRVGSGVLGQTLEEAGVVHDVL